jgi:hypothetical protein
MAKAASSGPPSRSSAAVVGGALAVVCALIAASLAGKQLGQIYSPPDRFSVYDPTGSSLLYKLRARGIVAKKELLDVNIFRPAADSVLNSTSLEWTVDGESNMQHICFFVDCCAGIWVKSNQPGRVFVELFLDGKNITFSNGNTAQVMLNQKVCA